MAKIDLQNYYKNSFLRRPYIVGGEIDYTEKEYAEGDKIALFTLPKNVIILRTIAYCIGGDADGAAVLKDEAGQFEAVASSNPEVTNVNKLTTESSVAYAELDSVPNGGKSFFLVEYVDQEVTTGGRTAVKEFK